MTPNPSSNALAQPHSAKHATRTETRSCTWRPPTATRVSDTTHRFPLLLPHCPPTFLSAQNHAGSTALHWATLNAHLAAARALVEYPDGPGVSLIDVKNAAGRSPLGEAEAAGWDEG